MLRLEAFRITKAHTHVEAYVSLILMHEDLGNEADLGVSIIQKRPKRPKRPHKEI